MGNYGAWAMKNSSGGVTIAGNSAYGGYDSYTGLFSYYTTTFHIKIIYCFHVRIHMMKQ